MAVPTTDPYLPFDGPRPISPLLTGLIVATVAVLIAGLVAAAALSTSQTNSPQDAVTSLLDAASSANVTGILSSIDPVEASAISGPLSQTVDDLKNLGVLNSSVDLHAVSGVSVSFSKVGMRTTAIDPSRPDLAAVTFTGGTATLHVDVSQLPLGSLVTGFLASRGVDAGSFERSAPLGGGDATEHPLVTVQRNGEWYVSIGYSIAETARLHAGLPFPTTPVPAVGASSATGVAQALVTAATGGDARRLVELLDPDEMQAVHDYADLFLAKLPPPSPSQVTVTSLGLSTAPVSGGTLVTVEDFSATVRGDVVSLTTAGCFVASGPDVPGGSRKLCEPSGSNLLAGYGIVAVQRGASWYLDPLRTLADDAEHIVRGVNVSELGRVLQAGGPAGLFADVLGFGTTATGNGVVPLRGSLAPGFGTTTYGTAVLPLHPGKVPPSSGTAPAGSVVVRNRSASVAPIP